MAQETKRDRYIWYAKQSGAIKVMSIAYQMYLSLLGPVPLGLVQFIQPATPAPSVPGLAARA